MINASGRRTHTYRRLALERRGRIAQLSLPPQPLHGCRSKSSVSLRPSKALARTVYYSDYT